MKTIKYYITALFLSFCLVTVAQAKDIGIGVKQFAQRVNNNLTEIGSPFEMPTNPKVATGDVNNTFTVMLSDHFGVVGTVDKKNNNVNGLMLTITPTTDSEENLYMLFSSSAIVSAFGGKGQMKTVGNRFVNMLTETMQEYGNTSDKSKGVEKSFTLNGKKYFILVNNLMGIFISAEFAK